MAPGVCNICETPYNQIFVYTINDGGLERKVCACDHCGKELMKQQFKLMEGTPSASTGADPDKNEKNIFHRDCISA